MKPDVTFKIDGKTVTAPAGSNLIDVAKDNQIEIPHYCYHTALPVAGNCRVCFVEVEGMPQPQIACNTPIKDGLVVNTCSAKAVEARKWTLEFLLANHPLDCPICDKAGECDLQNYSYKYGKTHTDFSEKKRTPATVQLSDKLWIEKDRCILCMRCVQFLREIGGKEELYVMQRGNAAEITTAPGKPVESPYQLNTVDLCPVGALSATNFRYAERVWNLKRYDSICPMCPRGCNTTVEVIDNQVQRMIPRFNAKVNSHWMCDEGREYFNKFQTHRERLNEPLKQNAVAPLSQIITEIGEVLKKTSSENCLVLMSNWLCNEDLAEVASFVKRYLPKATISGPAVKDGGDQLLRRWDFGPNAHGLRETFKHSFKEASTLKSNYSYIFSFGVDSQGLGITGKLIYCGAFKEACVAGADYAIPGLAHGEIDGSYTNFEGIEQHFSGFLKASVAAVAVDDLLARLGEVIAPKSDSVAEAI